MNIGMLGYGGVVISPIECFDLMSQKFNFTLLAGYAK